MSDVQVVPPPHNIEAEQAVLGAVLLSGNALRPLILEAGLRPEHFYSERHRVMFAAMIEMDEQGEHVDVLTLSDHLESTGDLGRAGGRAGIDSLTGGVPGLGGLRNYARIVIERWRWRQRLSSAYGQIAAVVVNDEPAFEVALQEASALVVLSETENYLGPRKLADHFFNWLGEEPNEGLPVPPELSSLSRLLRLRPGHVTVVAGWSHMGKSLYASQCAAAIGARGHRSVLWTNEDTAEEVVARYLNRVTGVPATAIADRKLTEDQLQKVLAELPSLPFEVQPCFGWDATQIARHIRQERPALAVVDHFHALPSVTRTEDIDAAMQTLVAAAGQAPCHLFLVAQLNQARSQNIVRPAPVPRDLRGSGQIYNLAHTVMFVHRQEEEERDMDDRPLGRAVQLDEGHIDVAKNKPNGKLGAVPVTFDARRLRFVQVAA